LLSVTNPLKDRNAVNTARKSSRRQAKTLALREFRRREANRERDAPSPLDPERAHADLENLTAPFREELARAHMIRAREAILDYHRANEHIWKLPHFETELFRKPIVEALRGSATCREWHERRAGGQRRRFSNVRNCGGILRKAWCATCGDERSPVPNRCGVRRVCETCDVEGAAARRARFGSARGRTLLSGIRLGLTRRNRKGGRFSEKMLTLTLPHAKLSDLVKGSVKARARDDVHARILALWTAIPSFMRRLRAYLKKREPFLWQQVRFHRSFEWTPASDGAGHPHFHIYAFAPFLDARLLRVWWGEALFDAGWPIDFDDAGFPKVRIDLRELRGFNSNAIRELLKGGRRSALTLSQIDRGPGDDAFSYAEGWTLGDIKEFCSPDVQARLYCALEGRRLTQASSGFFLEDEKLHCACCGSSNWRCHFSPIDADQPLPSYLDAFNHPAHERGPP
jgi:hypothetical protein